MTALRQYNDSMKTPHHYLNRKPEPARLTVRLDPGLLLDVQQVAEEHNRSVNAEIVTALKRWVKAAKAEREE
jgi:hypothetical protein